MNAQTLSKDLHTAILNLDGLVAERSSVLTALVVAIGRLSTDETIRQLALQAKEVAEDLNNDVNVFAEALGANAKGPSTADRIFGPCVARLPDLDGE